MTRKRRSTRKKTQGGWFSRCLAALRGPPSRSTSRSSPAGWAVWWRRISYVLLAALLVGCVWASFSVRRAVRGDDRLLLENWRVRLRETPRWVTPEIRDELTNVDLRHPQESLTVLDPGAIDWFSAKLEGCAWVRTIDDVRLVYPTLKEPGFLEVEIWLREPVLLVQTDGVYYLTDSESRRLGDAYEEPPTQWFEVPLLIGLNDVGPLPGVGERWPSQDVRQGVEVARMLYERGILHRYRSPPIDAIDVSNLHGRRDPSDSEIVLWWGDCALAWGRSSLSAGARTATAEKVLSALEHVLSNPEKFSEYATIHLYRSGEFMTGVRG